MSVDTVRSRSRLFGIELDCLTQDQTVARCESLIRECRPVQHVVLNASKVVLMEDDEELRGIVQRCDVVNADGQSILWAGRLLGVSIPERVTGIDLMPRLLDVAESNRWGVYFLGAREEVLDTFLEVVKARWPLLVVAGYHSGYFEDELSIVGDIRASGARLLMVGMPSPAKERFLARNLQQIGPVFAIGVGGSFDVYAGLTTRAPAWMRRIGLEWFFRFAQEPLRLWRRYLIGNARFIRIVARDATRRRHSTSR